MLFIAEVKPKSPFGWQSKHSWNYLFNLANEVGDMISVHTDPRWGGSFELIMKARRLTNKPILAKGIHSKDDDIERALAAGADYVLVVGRLPQIYLNKCFIEPYSLKGLKDIPESVKVVWNSRDLSDGDFKSETFAQARKIFKGWLCQASNIASMADVDPEADAVLVGTQLANFKSRFSSDSKNNL